MKTRLRAVSHWQKIISFLNSLIRKNPTATSPNMPKKKSSEKHELVRQQILKRFEEAERQLNDIHARRQEIIRGLTEQVEVARVEQAREELERS
ncbi:MAG: hypothetical protein V1738_01880 [Patescibacteria group bacterium]